MHASVDPNEHKSNTSSSLSINLFHEIIVAAWICGGVSVNHHTLSDFRVLHGEKLNEILTSSVASLIHQGFVSLEEIGQDGMRVRAAAGSSSFRRQPTLENLHDEAKKHLEELDGQRQNSDDEALRWHRKPIEPIEQQKIASRDQLTLPLCNKFTS